MSWLDGEVVMKTPDFWNNPASYCSVFDEDDDDFDNLLENFAT